MDNQGQAQQPAQAQQAQQQQAPQTAAPTNPVPLAPASQPPSSPIGQPQQQVNTPPQAGAPTTGVSFAPPPPKRGFPKKLVIILVIILLFSIIGIVVISILLGPTTPTSDPVGDTTFSADKTPVAGPREDTVEDYSTFGGIELNSDTVSFNKVNDSFRIRYRDRIFHEQDTGSFIPREVFPENADTFPWYGLVDAPDNLASTSGPGDKLFSFKAPVTYRSFVFIMRWDRPTGEVYEMFRFHDDKLTKLTEFKKDRIFYVPIIDGFSLGGNFMSINLFSCATCIDEQPEILLYHIPSGTTKNIGRVSYFAWGEDDNIYEYKVYREGVDPQDIDISRNEFFVDSENLDPSL